MLVKLLKHDFITLFKKISGIWLILGAAFAFQFLMADILKGGSGSYGPGVGNGIFMAFVVAGFAFSGFVIAGNWFSAKMYGDEGYLTNTLPAKSWQVVLSKFVVSAIFTMLSALFSILTLALMGARIIEGFGGIWEIFVTILGSGWKEVFQDWFIRGAIDFFISTLSFISLILFSISLSNSIDYGNKAVKTIVFILGFALVSQMIGNILVSDEGGMSLVGSFYAFDHLPQAFSTSAIINWVYSGVWILVYFFGTLFISEKHLKLRD